MVRVSLETCHANQGSQSPINSNGVVYWYCMLHLDHMWNIFNRATLRVLRKSMYIKINNCNV